MADDLRFALDRLARIAEIKDAELFEAKLREFARDFPQLKADLLADPKSARALLPALVKGLEQGLAGPDPVQGAKGHEPAGSPEGGQFASGDGGSVLAAKTMWKESAPGNSATPRGGGSHTSETFGAGGSKP